MTRTYKHKCVKEKKTYVGMNHTKRLDHEMKYALNDSRANHTFDKGRIEGKQRGTW